MICSDKVSLLQCLLIYFLSVLESLSGIRDGLCDSSKEDERGTYLHVQYSVILIFIFDFSAYLYLLYSVIYCVPRVL